MELRPSDVRRHRAERYVILTLLVESRSPWVPVRTLYLAMDRRNHSISLEKLVFHLERVLEPEGMVALRRVRELPEELREFDRRALDEIDAVRVMPKGITAVNEPTKFTEVERP